MVLLTNDEFLARLTRMFQTSRTSGVVRVTMKRYNGKTKPTPKNSNSNEATKSDDYDCLIRATCRNKKIATTVNHQNITEFQLAYCMTLRSNLDGLKKLKKPKSKPKAT